ncbi:hypothetical protein [Angustibacter sp. Root456]|uniref:hypothetical protein n=1 Tax=Angustibacter sp. Root456 TaxID=1736539 RepID=UPI0006F3F5A6|nr:hypothetical protein [Angustibacter sp. Root456]KQX61602.1 hypothetical protein ASD06_13360 [Angustibacter sp. Root456]
MSDAPTASEPPRAAGDATVVPALLGAPRGAVAYWTVGLSAALAAVIVLGSFAGPVLAAAAVALTALAMAWGWPDLLDLPSPRGTRAVVALAGAGCALAVAATPDEPRLRWLALAVALGVLAEFVHQLARRDARPRLVESVTGSVMGIAVLASLSALVALPATAVSATGVVVWGAGVVTALAGVLLPWPGRLSYPVAVVCGGLVAALLGGLFAQETVVVGLLTGLVCATTALVLHRMLAVLPASARAPGWVALAVAPLASSGAVAYVLLRLLVG